MRPKTFIIRHFVIHLILLVLTVASVSKGLAAQEKLTRTKAQKEQPQTNQVIKSELEGTVEVSFKIDNGGKVQILEMNATSQAIQVRLSSIALFSKNKRKILFHSFYSLMYQLPI
jgi:hypothetical protein